MQGASLWLVSPELRSRGGLRFCLGPKKNFQFAVSVSPSVKGDHETIPDIGEQHDPGMKLLLSCGSRGEPAV